MAATVSEQHALDADAADELLQRWRPQFLVPAAADGRYEHIAYLAGHSLGLQPRRSADVVAEQLTRWARLAVEGHHEPPDPWTSYADRLRAPLARLVGAEPDEVVAMNSLTVNLHLLMASFYRPRAERTLIVIEDAAFPSDSYAVRSQAAWHGLDPDRTVVRLTPRAGEAVLRTEDVVARIHALGPQLALVLLGGVNYLTGEVLDIDTITRAGHEVGAMVGWDLAHAAGNVALRLHEWDVDWAAWCTYKYLNGGPGSVAAAFVHRRYLGDPTVPRLAGWWGTAAHARFEMRPTLDPVDAADAWALSNPPILALAPVVAAVEMFDEVGLPALRARSVALTAYLLDQLDRHGVEVITPRDPQRRGAQLSARIADQDVTRIAARLRAEFAVIADARPPDIIRFAPVPFYVSHHDCWRAAAALADVVGHP